jgi:hypothetical protein
LAATWGHVLFLGVHEILKISSCTYENDIHIQKNITLTLKYGFYNARHKLAIPKTH